MSVPYLWMGPRWGAWLEFGSSCDHEEFLSIADKVCRDFDGVVTERMGSGDDDKEYWWIDVAGANLLLMYKHQLGSGLSAEQQDIKLLETIGQSYGAYYKGWRWPLYRL